MRAVWYESSGAAHDVLQLADCAIAQTAADEVRVRVEYSAVNPYDVKKRGHGRELSSFGRVIPHADGSGVIERVGDNVPQDREGEHVWLFGAQVGQAQGSCAEYVVVPAWKAIPLPESISLREGACLGIPVVTAFQSLFSDGPIEGKTILVAGGAGRVGAYAIQIASLCGANVIATASAKNLEEVKELGAEHVVDYAEPDLAETLRALIGKDGADRIVESRFARNMNLNSQMIARNGVIAAYGIDDDPTPTIPALQLLMKNAVCRFVGIFGLSRTRQEALFGEVNEFLSQHRLTHRVGLEVSLRETADAHHLLETGGVSGAALIRI